ncbi:MAG: S8 family serine peptidase [Niastella sp.]|nr:S8 family serine peptidase [Niastella sp.]
MKKLLCFFTAMLCMAVTSFAQNVHKGYCDGMVWYKLKDAVHAQYRSQATGRQIAVEEFSFLQPLKKRLSIREVKAPFAKTRTVTALHQTYELRFDEKTDADSVIAALVKSGTVEYAEKVPLDEITLVPNDRLFNVQSFLNQINAPAAWEYANGANTVIAIIDNAIQPAHEDLAPNLWTNAGEIPGNGIDDDGNGYIDDIHGWDVSDNDNDVNPPYPAFYHGTPVAGLASAATNNGKGIASVGYGCKLMCIKAASTPNSIGEGYQGILYAADNGAHVINCSWGNNVASETALNIIKYAISKGCIVVGGAGNNNNNLKFYPAAYPGVISVAAVVNDVRASYSNYGDWVTISAPTGVMSTYLNNSYQGFGGTSAASPIVAGLVGLIRSVNPNMPNSEIIRCLTSTGKNIDAVNPGYEGKLGAGLIDAGAAIQAALLTLTHKAVPAFTTNYSTISAKGRITFTDSSYYGPDSYQWTFEGGTPSSYTGRTPPPVYYYNVGTFAASLTVTNHNGSDTKTMPITVNPSVTCGAINYPIPADWDSIQYYLGSPDGMSGWVNGMNLVNDKQKAMYFDANTGRADYITKVQVRFGKGYSTDTTKIVPVHVFDGTAGVPGALLGTAQTTMGQIMRDVAGSRGTFVYFQQPIALPASNRFFVSVDLTNLCWDAAGLCQDTLSISCSGVGPGSIWEQKRNGQWYPYGSYDSWSVLASLYIHPYLTNEPSVATFTRSSNTVCAGNTILFNAAGSAYEDGLAWSFPGGSPATVNDLPTTSILFATPGTYEIQLTTKGGSCNDTRTATHTVVVTAPVTPSVQLNSSSTSISPGVPIIFTAVAQQAGPAPVYDFRVNDSSVQVSNNNTWTSADLNINDVVSCDLSSSMECITSSIVSSNSIAMGSGTLPVTLLSFKGRAAATGNLLTWETTSEVNTAWFIIERSTDGVSFREAGRIAAAGQSALTKQYSFTDRGVFITDVHYRLRMIDQDGDTEYSSIVIIKIKPQLILTTTAWPQPVQRGIPVNVKISTGQPGRVIAQVVNAFGQVIATESGMGNNGTWQYRIATQQLSGGLYFIRFYNNAHELLGSHKIVVTE